MKCNVCNKTFESQESLELHEAMAIHCRICQQEVGQFVEYPYCSKHDKLPLLLRRHGSTMFFSSRKDMIEYLLQSWQGEPITLQEEKGGMT